MQHRHLFALIALLFLTFNSAHAQSVIDEHKIELGGQYTAIGLDDFDVVNGLGARFGYNFTDHLALDAEANFFPETKLGNDQFGQKAQGFVGLKAGGRSKYAGLFAKARPGVMSISEVTSGFSCSRFPRFTECRPNHSNFALDAGGVAEFYPSRRSIIRLDVGDTMVNVRRATRGSFFNTIPPQTSSDFTHNLQVSFGFSYRF